MVHSWDVSEPRSWQQRTTRKRIVIQTNETFIIRVALLAKGKDAYMVYLGIWRRICLRAIGATCSKTPLYFSDNVPEFFGIFLAIRLTEWHIWSEEDSAMQTEFLCSPGENELKPPLRGLQPIFNMRLNRVVLNSFWRLYGVHYTLKLITAWHQISGTA